MKVQESWSVNNHGSRGLPVKSWRKEINAYKEAKLQHPSSPVWSLHFFKVLSLNSWYSRSTKRTFPCSVHVDWTPGQSLYLSVTRTKKSDCIRSLAAAAAKSLQSCPTLCDHIDGSPPGFPVPGILQGKNTRMGCHFLLQCMKVKRESEVTQLCPILSDPMDCSLPGSSIRGVFQARVLEWVAIAFSTRVLGTYKRISRYFGYLLSIFSFRVFIHWFSSKAKGQQTIVHGSSHRPHVFVNKVLLEHSHAPSFPYFLYWFCATIAGLSSYNRDHVVCKS